MKTTLILAINLFFGLIESLIFIRIILSWLPINRDNKYIRSLIMLTEPVLGPIRKMIKKSIFGGGNMMLDFSPLIAIVLIDLIKNILKGIISTL